jgi:hypothetical protein
MVPTRPPILDRRKGAAFAPVQVRGIRLSWLRDQPCLVADLGRGGLPWSVSKAAHVVRLAASLWRA